MDQHQSQLASTTPAASVSGDPVMALIKDELMRANDRSVDCNRAGHVRSESYWEGYSAGLRYVVGILQEARQ